MTRNQILAKNVLMELVYLSFVQVLGVNKSKTTIMLGRVLAVTESHLVFKMYRNSTIKNIKFNDIKNIEVVKR